MSGSAYEAAYRRSLDDPEGFWARRRRTFIGLAAGRASWTTP